MGRAGFSEPVGGAEEIFCGSVRLEDLPAVDVILVSHDHYDHLGAATIRKLAGLEQMRGSRWVTSLGVGRFCADLAWMRTDLGAGLDG